MSSGGANPPRPLSHDSSGKGTTAKKRRYVVRLLQPRDSLPSSTPSSSSVSMPVRPLDVTPTPSSPPTKARPSSYLGMLATARDGEGVDVGTGDGSRASTEDGDGVDVGARDGPHALT